MKKEKLILMTIPLTTISSILVTSKILNKAIYQKNSKIEKFKSYYDMLNQWIIIKQNGKSLEEYFIKNNYKKIAIYGMGEMGKRLYDDLKNTNIEIKYAVDKNATAIYSDLNIINVEDNFEIVDVIIITAIFDFKQIFNDIKNKCNFDIISLEDVIYGIY